MQYVFVYNDELITRSHIVIGFDLKGCGGIDKVSVVPIGLRAWEDIEVDGSVANSRFGVRGCSRPAAAKVAASAAAAALALVVERTALATATRLKTVGGEEERARRRRSAKNSIWATPSLVGGMVLGGVLVAVGALVGGVLTQRFCSTPSRAEH